MEAVLAALVAGSAMKQAKVAQPCLTCEPPSPPPSVLPPLSPLFSRAAVFGGAVCGSLCRLSQRGGGGFGLCLRTDA
jgi:hypothetical protein